MLPERTLPTACPPALLHGAPCGAHLLQRHTAAAARGHIVPALRLLEESGGACRHTDTSRRLHDYTTRIFVISTQHMIVLCLASQATFRASLVAAASIRNGGAYCLIYMHMHMHMHMHIHVA